MATTSLTRNNTLPNTSQKTDFYALIDNATVNVSAILGTDISNLTNLPSSAGLIPVANIAQSLASGQYAYYNGTNLVGANVSAGGGSGTSTTVRGTFNYGSLVSGVCSVSHLVSLAFPYTLDIALVGASSSGNWKVLPDQFGFGASAFSVQMTSYLTQSNASVLYGWAYTA
jgi:hypothetical protein